MEVYQLKGREMCDCGHLESEHSSFTRGYGRDSEGKTMCYACCTAADEKQLADTGKLCAYISRDGKHITNWPGSIIAAITSSHVVNFGYCRDQVSFAAITPDGTHLVGRGPGKGMYCRVRRVKK